MIRRLCTSQHLKRKLGAGMGIESFVLLVLNASFGMKTLGAVFVLAGAAAFMLVFYVGKRFLNWLLLVGDENGRVTCSKLSRLIHILPALRGPCRLFRRRKIRRVPFFWVYQVCRRVWILTGASVRR